MPSSLDAAPMAAETIDAATESSESACGSIAAADSGTEGGGGASSTRCVSAEDGSSSIWPSPPNGFLSHYPMAPGASATNEFSELKGVLGVVSHVFIRIPSRQIRL